MKHFRTILHPTDFSSHSEQAFRLACALARDYGARLIVLHVVQPLFDLYDAEGRLLPRPADWRETARQKLAQLIVPELQVDCRMMEGGEAASVILNLAREEHADLIVMGTQGRTGLDRLVIGSVAEDVLRKALCPVVTAKAPVGK